MTEWDAAEYSRRSSLQEAMAQEVLALLDLNGSERILDVGCGEGKVTAEIASRVPRGLVVGVDPSHDMIGFAKKHFTLANPTGASLGNVRFEVADALRLSFQDPYLRLTPDEYVAVAERNGFRVLRVNTQDHSWDFGSRAAFAGFCAVGLVAWTDRLPAAERQKFLDDVLDRYQSVAATRAGE